MPVLKEETLPIRTEGDVVLVRQLVRKWASELGFSLVDQTKIVTAASELARNTLIHGLGGSARLTALSEGVRKGLRLSFEDQGPGIADIELALRDGYTTGGGLGLGLFRTFGTNALVAFILHELVGGAVGPFVPRDAPLLYLAAGFLTYFGIIYLFVRHLEKNGIYLKL